MPHKNEKPQPLPVAVHEHGLNYWEAQKAVRDGKLPAVLVGRRWYVTPEALAAWMRRRAAEAATSGRSA